MILIICGKESYIRRLSDYIRVNSSYELSIYTDTAALMEEFERKKGNWTDTKYLCRFGYLGLGLVMFVCAINILSLIRRPPGSNVNGYDRLAKILLENDLTYGYSELWNGANVTTVLSDSRVKIRPIYFSDGAYSINPYQSEAGWYEDQPETEKYFVLVTASEKEKTENILSKNAIKEIEFEDDQTILVFDRNIFENGEPVFKESNQ